MNVEKYVYFLNKLEWEGGLEGLVCYGWDESTGDNKLDIYIEQLDSLIVDINARMRFLAQRYDKEIEDRYNELAQ